jgi:hypothetical protein
MKTTPDQLSLPLFDTTALTSSMGLYSGLSFGERVDDSIAETEDDAPAPVVVPACNFRLTTTRRLAPDWKTRGADNVAAIRLLRQIQDEARNATAEEQERLALFTSFGASELANTLFRRSAEEALPKGWEALGQDLEQLVSPGELASLARVTQYAHFTPEFIGSAIWRALRRMGFSGGRVLEPGCGTGLFFALMPEALADKTTLTGVEMDPITARIRKTPLSERANPRRGLHQGAHRRDVRPRHRQPAVQQPHRPRRRSRRPAQPVAPRLLHFALDRAASAGRPRGLRHEPLDHGQGRSDGPQVSRLHGRSRRRRAPARRRHARGGRNRRRRRHPVLPEARSG